MNGTGAVGATTAFSREDHIHPSDTTKLSDAPSDGTIYGRKDAVWTEVESGGGSSVFVSDTAPVGAPDNSMWWDSNSGILYVRYNDGSSTQWVQICGSGGSPTTRQAMLPNVMVNL